MNSSGCGKAMDFSSAAVRDWAQHLVDGRFSSTAVDQASGSPALLLKKRSDTTGCRLDFTTMPPIEPFPDRRSDSMVNSVMDAASQSFRISCQESPVAHGMCSEQISVSWRRPVISRHA